MHCVEHRPLRRLAGAHIAALRACAPVSLLATLGDFECTTLRFARQDAARHFKRAVGQRDVTRMI
jgi:hypothetical protein